MHASLKDVGAGTFFIFVGLLYGSIAWLSLPIGNAFSMGPGYFPVVLSGILVALGLLIVWRSFINTEEREPFGVVPWRGVIMISLATLIFAATAETIGLLPSVFVTTFIATMADRKIKPLRAVFISLCIAVFCTAVFGYGIRLPIPVFGEWPIW